MYRQHRQRRDRDAFALLVEVLQIVALRMKREYCDVIHWYHISSSWASPLPSMATCAFCDKRYMF